MKNLRTFLLLLLVGSALGAAPPAAPQWLTINQSTVLSPPVAQDTFATTGSLNAFNWATVTGAAALNVAAPHTVELGTTTGANGAAVWIGYNDGGGAGTCPANQFATVTTGTLGDPNAVAGPVVRASQGAMTFYDAVLQGPYGTDTASLYINKFVAGTSSTLTSQYLDVTAAAGNPVSLSIVGDTLTAQVGSGANPPLVTTDNSITSGCWGMTIEAKSQASTDATLTAFVGGPVNVNTGAAPPPPSGTFNYHPGDYGRAYRPGGAWGASVANTIALIQQFEAKPLSGGYAVQFSVSDYENGSTIDQGPDAIVKAQQGTGNFSGLTTFVAPILNYLFATSPGIRFGIYIDASTEYQNPAENIGYTTGLPSFILNASGGHITVPNSFGSSSTTAYTMQQNPYSQSGFVFAQQSGSNYVFLYAGLQEPAVVQILKNDAQALASYIMPTASAYNSGTTYSQGMIASSGGTTYLWTNATAAAGHAPPNSTYWIAYSNPYAGMALNTIPELEFLGNNDETSIVADYSANPGSWNYTTYFAGYKGWIDGIAAAFPNRIVWPCLSYSVTGTDGQTSPSQYYSSAGSGSGSWLASLLSTQGIGLGGADTYGSDWTTTTASATSGAPFANPAKLAFVGINPSTSYVGTNVNMTTLMGGYTANFQNVSPNAAMVEPDDYQNKPVNGSNAYQYTAALIGYMEQAGSIQNVNYMIWDTVSKQSYNTTDWAGYIQPAILSYRPTYPLNTARPSNLP